MLWPNDVKEELSLAYALAVASRAGFSVELTRKDRDSVDFIIRARAKLTEDATLLSPAVDVQMKAHVLDPLPADDFSYALDVKNYNDLVGRCLIPRILVVFIMPENVEHWLSSSEDELVLRRSAYWTSLFGQEPTANASTKTVKLSRANVFDPKALRSMLERVGREEAV